MKTECTFNLSCSWNVGKIIISSFGYMIVLLKISLPLGNKIIPATINIKQYFVTSMTDALNAMSSYLSQSLSIFLSLPQSASLLVLIFTMVADAKSKWFIGRYSVRQLETILSKKYFLFCTSAGMPVNNSL